MRNVCRRCVFLCSENKEEFVDDFESVSPNYIHQWYGIPEHIPESQLVKYYNGRLDELKAHNMCQDSRFGYF